LTFPAQPDEYIPQLFTGVAVEESHDLAGLYAAASKYFPSEVALSIAKKSATFDKNSKPTMQEGIEDATDTEAFVPVLSGSIRTIASGSAGFGVVEWALMIFWL
jgi:hypothetical protein